MSVQFATSRRGVPHANSLRSWADSALRAAKYDGVGTLCIRVVGAKESRALNAQWRGKEKPTNVLSFPYSEGDLRGARATGQLGDLAICASVVAVEARDQGKPLAAHWAHMVVHGVLHLLGYDHEKTRDAVQMEALEVEILQRMGFRDPYQP